MKIRPVGAELSHAEGRTDGTTEGVNNRRTDTTVLIVAFLNSANEPKNLHYVCWFISFFKSGRHTPPPLQEPISQRSLADCLEKAELFFF